MTGWSTQIRSPVTERGRPIVHEIQRAHLLAALACFDYVALFTEHTPRLIQTIRPDVLVEGSDYVRYPSSGETVEANGGHPEFVPVNEWLSTGMVNGIIERHLS